VLLPVLKADEQNADAWWLMANALTDPNDAREALETLLRLRPDHDKAQRMLDRINELYPRPQPEPEPEPGPGEFGFGDSASDPFAGADPFAIPETSAPPVETYTLAEDEVAEAEEDPFAFAAPETGRPAATDIFGGPAQTFGPVSAGEEDPFAAPAPKTGRTAADPFGGPAQTFGAPAAAEEGEDPFAIRETPARAAAEAPRRKARPRVTEDDPFGPAAGARPARSAQRAAAGSTRTAAKKKGGTNPLVILLAVLGGVVLLVGLGCLALTYVLPSIGINVAQQVISQIDTSGIMGTLQAQGYPINESFVGTLEAGGFSEMIGTLEAGGMPEVLVTFEAMESFTFGGIGSAQPAEVMQRGSLGYGESRRDTLEIGQQHGWTFNGSGGDRVVIDLVAGDSSSGFDAFLTLYDPQRLQVAYNDDREGGGYDSHLEYTLPANGTYTIVARSFSFTGGKYELRLNRQ